MLSACLIHEASIEKQFPYYKSDELDDERSFANHKGQCLQGKVNKCQL